MRHGHSEHQGSPEVRWRATRSPWSDLTQNVARHGGSGSSCRPDLRVSLHHDRCPPGLARIPGRAAAGVEPHDHPGDPPGGSPRPPTPQWPPKEEPLVSPPLPPFDLNRGSALQPQHQPKPDRQQGPQAALAWEGCPLPKAS